MNLDALKKRLLQELEETKSRLEDLEFYQKIKEKWDHLSPKHKKIFFIATPCFLLLFLLFPVYSDFSAAEEFLTEFEAKKDLIRTLMLTQKDLSEIKSPRGGLNLPLIKDRIKTDILQDGLLPEQSSAIEEFKTFQGSSVFPEQVIEGGLEFKLSQITIKQLVHIATKIENLGAQVKIRDLIVNADMVNKGYINATLKILIFKISDPQVLPPTSSEPPKRGRQ
jgi:hypothetical protein